MWSEYPTIFLPEFFNPKAYLLLIPSFNRTFVHSHRRFCIKKLTWNGMIYWLFSFIYLFIYFFHSKQLENCKIIKLNVKLFEINLEYSQRNLKQVLITSNLMLGNKQWHVDFLDYFLEIERHIYFIKRIFF